MTLRKEHLDGHRRKSDFDRSRRDSRVRYPRLDEQRIQVPDLAAYENIHADRLAALHNVGQLVTYISMADFSEA